ncbi:MAG: preprotein translocase subunit SecG [Candidatus Tokpelaia sp. JSC188]|nr:MAG: preprotein translocase subunit SecG [Candidatus Tokpelaia sp. JSC188]
MQTFVIVIHLLIIVALIGVILIQRSEGGGLGIGGGSGFMTIRATKNALTRLTAILASGFFLTSIVLSVLQSVPRLDILDKVPLSSYGDVSANGNAPNHLGNLSVEQDKKVNPAIPPNENRPAVPSESKPN